MPVRFAVLLGIVASIAACSHQTAPEGSMHSEEETLVLKVAVFADGRLTVDGAPSSIDDLRVSIREIAEQGGTVWYYRESAQSDPPPIAMEAIQAVVEAGAPIRLSTRPDYSDSVVR